jgi:hypothetical protein
MDNGTKFKAYSELKVLLFGRTMLAISINLPISGVNPMAAFL